MLIRIDLRRAVLYCPAFTLFNRFAALVLILGVKSETVPKRKRYVMKVRSSLKSLKTRHRDCKIVRRKGVVYVINKTDPRFKAKQG